MYAVVRTGSKQYRVKESDEIEVERINSEPGTEVTLEEVLLVVNGEKLQVGRPYVDNARIVAEVLGHPRGRKLIAFKYRRRKSSKTKIGHRQELTRLRIKAIKA